MQPNIYSNNIYSTRISAKKLPKKNPREAECECQLAHPWNIDIKTHQKSPVGKGKSSEPSFHPPPCIWVQNSFVFRVCLTVDVLDLQGRTIRFEVLQLPSLHVGIHQPIFCRKSFLNRKLHGWKMDPDWRFVFPIEKNREKSIAILVYQKVP